MNLQIVLVVYTKIFKNSMYFVTHTTRPEYNYHRTSESRNRTLRFQSRSKSFLLGVNRFRSLSRVTRNIVQLIALGRRRAHCRSDLLSHQVIITRWRRRACEDESWHCEFNGKTRVLPLEECSCLVQSVFSNTTKFPNLESHCLRGQFKSWLTCLIYIIVYPLISIVVVSFAFTLRLFRYKQ